MGINFIILHLFSLLDKRCIDTFASPLQIQKELPKPAALFACVLGGRKNTHRVGRTLC